MRHTALITLTAVLLVFATTLPLQAQGWRYRTDSDAERVAELAQELETIAADISTQFERNNRRPSWAETRVMADLQRLQERASSFHGEAENALGESRYARDAILRDDFRALERAFFNVAESLPLIRPRGYVDQGMERIYDLMSDISRYSGYRGVDSQ